MNVLNGGPISLNISDRNSSYCFLMSLRTLLKICIADLQSPWCGVAILALHLTKDVNWVTLPHFGLPLKFSILHFFNDVLSQVVREEYSWRELLSVIYKGTWNTLLYHHHPPLSYFPSMNYFVQGNRILRLTIIKSPNLVQAAIWSSPNAKNKSQWLWVETITERLTAETRLLFLGPCTKLCSQCLSRTRG